MKRYYNIIVLLCLYSCHPDKNEKVSLPENFYKTTDASEIFFKNVRKSTYQLSEMPEAGLDIYTKDELTESLVLKPSIIINWREDMAFFHFEKESDQVVILIHKPEDIDTIYFEGNNHKEHAELGLEIYNAILTIYPITHIQEGEQKVFSDNKLSDMFRIMYFDFLKLIEVK